MADPILPQPDDHAPAYLAAREGAQSQEALDFLLATPGSSSPVVTEGGGEQAASAPAARSGFETYWNATQAMTARLATDFAVNTFEVPSAIAGGIRDAGQELFNAAGSLANWLGVENNGVELPETDPVYTPTGEMTHDVSQFVAGFVPALRAARLLKVGQGASKAAAAAGAGRTAAPLGTFAESSLAGAVTDATVFDPYEERLADNLAQLLEDHPGLAGPVKEYLGTNPDDPEALARFKRAAEGFGLGTAAEGLGLGLSILSKGRRAARARPATSDTVLDEIPPAARSEAQENAVQEVTALPALGDPKKPLVELVSEKNADDFLKNEGGESAARVNINLSRLETPEDVQEAITQTGKMFSGRMDEASRGQVSHVETERLATDLGMTVETLLGRRAGQAFNAEEALAARQILASSGEQLTTLAKKAASPDGSPADLMAFRRALSLHTAIQEQVSGMTAEAGRALSAFRIMAKGSVDRNRQITELLDGAGGDLFNRDMARRLADIADQNPGAFNKAARAASQASGWDQLYEVWINGLLSGPQTHAVNTLSNALVSVWQIPERWLASQIGRALGGDGGVAVGEATAQAFGLARGYRDGLKMFSKALRTGESTDYMGKVEQAYRSFTAENFARTGPGRAVNALTGGSLDRGGIAARGVDLLGEVARLPSRFLTAEDELFKAVGYRMELNAQAFRTATAEGLSGEALARRVSDIVENPPENIHLAAVDTARYQTFTKPLGETGQKVQQVLRAYPALRLIAPFVRTPTNIMKYVGERTPLAVLSRDIRADIASGGARRDLALARIGLGSMTMAAAAEMTASGALTGGGPKDPGMRQILRNTGWQPYSVKIGDTYYSYGRLDPLGMLLGLAADTAEIMGQAYGEAEDVQGIEDTPSVALDLGSTAVMALAKNVTSKTWLSGVSELIETIEDPDRNMERFLSRFAGTIVPTGVAQINRTMVDPTLRDTNGLDLWQTMVNQVKSRLPGYSDDLPPRTNMWGDPIVLGGGLGPDIVSPIYTSSEKASPIDEEILRLGMPVSMPRRNINGVELTAHEYHRYVELAGNAYKDPSTGMGLKDTLDAIVTGKHTLSGSYQRAIDGPEGGKALIIGKMISAFRQAAQQQVVKETPELRELIEEKRRQGAINLGAVAP